MGIFTKISIFAAATALTVQPVHACWSDAAHNAVKVKHLNTMLMVTALRCRSGSDNFLPHYNQFVSKNNRLIGQQNALIRSQLRRTMSAKAAVSANDNMSVGFANLYGTGHPDMGCGELKTLTLDAASQRRDMSWMINLADRVLGQTPLPGRRCKVQIASSK